MALVKDAVRHRKTARKSARKAAKKSAARKTARKGARHSPAHALGGATAPAKTSISRAGAAARRTLRDMAPPQGFIQHGDILVPIPKHVVPVDKLRRGFADAKRQFDKTIGALITSFGDGYDVAEIEVTASFSADGKFLGFGVGGAASITLRIRPSVSP